MTIPIGPGRPRLFPSKRHPRGISMLEVVIAVLVLAVLGVAIQGTMVGTLQGVQIDRASEVKRRVCLDLLERFSHPYSDIDSLFAASETRGEANESKVLTRELEVDEALKLIAMPAQEADEVKKTLQAGNVRGFTLNWRKGIESEVRDSPSALRLDRLWCFAIVSRSQPGATSDAFRMFSQRGR